MGTQWFLEFKRIIREEADSYIKEAALFCSYQFIRASDLDSLLADFHITSEMLSNVQNLPNSDKLFKKLIDFLNKDKYIESKLVCAWHLEYVEFDHTYKIIYFYGSLHNFCLLFQNLVCAEYSQTILNNKNFNNEIFRFLEFQRMIREEADSYIKEDASFCSYQFIRTSDCFHITSKMFSIVKNLFNSDKLFKKLMGLPNENKYIKTKLVYAWHLKYVEFDHTHNIIDFYCSLHGLLFQKLVCAKMICNQTILNNRNFNDEIFSFNTFGNIMALGDLKDLALKKKRIVDLPFLLLWEEEHMIMCDRAKPPFQLFSFKKLKKYDIHIHKHRTNNIFNLRFGYPGNFWELQRQSIEESDSIITGDASFRSYQFIRTCVLDSLLAAFHTTFKKFPNVKVLFNLDEHLRKVMALLNDKMYVKAKVVCAMQLTHAKFDHNQTKIDFYGSLYDHIILFHTLVWPYNQKIPNNSNFNYEIFSNFYTFGNIMALRNPDDPTLILVYNLTAEPLLRVENKKKRIFELQFLLLGKEGHMTMCFRFSRNEWLYYDNDRTKPSFQPFSFEKIKEYDICMAGYVNISQAQEYEPQLNLSLGYPESPSELQTLISEEARSYIREGATFYDYELKEILDSFFGTGQPEDVEMEDLTSVDIPEAGEGLDQKAFCPN